MQRKNYREKVVKMKYIFDSVCFLVVKPDLLGEHGLKWRMMFTIQHSTSGTDVRYRCAAKYFWYFASLRQIYEIKTAVFVCFQVSSVFQNSPDTKWIDLWGSSRVQLGVNWPLKRGVSAGCQLAITGKRHCSLSSDHYREASVLAVSWPLQGRFSYGSQLATTGRRQCWRSAGHSREALVRTVSWLLQGCFSAGG